MNMKSMFCLFSFIFNDDMNIIETFSTDDNMQTSIHSIIPDGSDKFFTIDESYCPTMQNYPLNFDDIIRQTLWHYVENVNQY